MFSKLIKLSTALLLAVCFFAACEKDIPVVPDNTDTVRDNSAQMRNLSMTESAGCYEIVLPITFIYEDESTVTVNTEEELLAIFESEPFPVDVGYPVNLQDLETGETVSANDEEELAEFLSTCEFDWEDDDDDGPVLCDSVDVYTGFLGCYDLVFPLSFELEDGSTVTAETEDDLLSIFDEDNPPVDFAYPITLEDLETGETTTVNNEEELLALLEECDGYGDWPDGDGPCGDIDIETGFLGCYDLVFPVSFELEDGSTVTANNEDELEDIFFSTSPPVNFVYPLTLENEEGEQVTANDEEELAQLLEDCFDYGDWPDDDDDGPICDSVDVNTGFLLCYDLVFPISFELEDGSTATAESEDDLFSIFDEDNPPVDFVYPITLESLEDGTTVTVNSEEELEDLLESCIGFDGGGDSDHDFDEFVVYPLSFVSIDMEGSDFDGCYSYNYPISLLDSDDNTIEINSDDELINTLFGGDEIVDFVYPISLTDNDSGETLTINNAEEAWDLVENCEP